MKKVFIFILLCLLLSGCGMTEDDIHIVFTSDIHGNVDNGMGYSGLKSYVKSLKKENSYVTLIDGGDFSEGTEFANDSKGEVIIDLMNDAGYNIATLGNHEFDFGLEALANNIKKADFDIVDCNVKYTGTGEDPFKNIKPYVIKKYGPIKIAYIGITTPEALKEEKDSYQNCLENGEVAYSLYFDPYNSDGGDEIFARVQSVIDEVRPNVDHVVVVSHLGKDTNCPMNTQTLINFTRGIDIVLDSHDHTTEDTIWENLDGEGVLFFAVGKDFERVGHVIIKTDGTIEHEYIQ